MTVADDDCALVARFACLECHIVTTSSYRFNMLDASIKRYRIAETKVVYVIFKVGRHLRVMRIIGIISREGEIRES